MHTGVWTDQGRNHRPGEQPRAGRQPTAETLAELATLEAAGWLVLHDLPRPGRRFAAIDHVAVGPGGVAVIDTRHWAGAVEVVGGVLRQNGAPRDRECELARDAAAAVTAWLEPGQRTAVRSVLALVGQPTPTHQPSTTVVCGVRDLATMLLAWPPRLSAAQIATVAELLRRTLAGGSVPGQLTTAALATALAETAPTAPPRLTRLSVLSIWRHAVRRNGDGPPGPVPTTKESRHGAVPDPHLRDRGVVRRRHP